MKELVKYNNYLNSLSFKEFTAADFDLFFYLCSAMKDKGIEEMSFSMAEISECIGYQHKGTANEFAKMIDRMNKKLLSMLAHIETSTELISFVLFPTFRVNKQTGILTVRVNKDFQYLLNELTKNFTQFELAEFTELNSKYSKTLYRLLKQFRSTGEYFVKVEELRELLGCPESYPNKYVMRDVIAPSVKELQKDFPTLACEPIRARTKGRPVTGYHFTFEADNGQIPGQMTIDEAAEEVIRYKAKKIREQTKNNKFTDFQQRQEDEDLDAIMMKRTQAMYGKKTE